MGVLIVAKTAAETSKPFVVQRNDRVGLKARGLAGAEEITIQRQADDGQFYDIRTNATFTADEDEITIQASGTYRVVKPVTAGAAGVSYD